MIHYFCWAGVVGCVLPSPCSFNHGSVIEGCYENPKCSGGGGKHYSNRQQWWSDWFFMHGKSNKDKIITCLTVWYQCAGLTQVRYQSRTCATSTIISYFTTTSSTTTSRDLHILEVQCYVVEHIVTSEDTPTHHQRLSLFLGKDPNKITEQTLKPKHLM